MTTLEDQIRALYQQLADSEQPPSAISVADAGHRGRSVRRRRRVLTIATPLLAAIGVLAVALATVPALRTGSAPSSVSGGSPALGVQTGGPGQPPVPLPGQFDPFTVHMSFGWLPPGEEAIRGSTSLVFSTLEAVAARDVTVKDTAAQVPPGFVLTDYAANVCQLSGDVSTLTCLQPTITVGGQAMKVDGPTIKIAGQAPEVNGHSAYWYAPTQSLTLIGNAFSTVLGQRQALAWEYAPGHWAQLWSAADPSQLTSQTLLRVARNVVFGGSAVQPVKFAMQLTDVPADWYVDGAAIDRPNGTSGTWLASGFSVTTSTNALSIPEEATLPGYSDYIPGRSPFRIECPAIGPTGLLPVAHAEINGYGVDVGARRTAASPPPSASVSAPGSSPTPSASQPQSSQQRAPLLEYLCAQDASGTQVVISQNEYPVDPMTLFRGVRVLGADPGDWVSYPIG